MHRFLLISLFFLFPGARQIEHFELERVIQLSNEILFGSIRSLDVAKNGDLLVFDQTPRTVALFDSVGHLITTLDAEPCHPGFNTRPISAVYTGRQIFMTNSGPWGYRFNLEGECVGPVDELFLPPPLLAGSESGDIWGFYGREERITRMDSLGKTISSFTSPRTDFPNLQRRFAEGELLVSANSIYFASPIDYAIYRFTLDGDLIQTIGEKPRGYRRPPRDLPERLSIEQIGSLGSILGETTTTLGIDQLDEHLLMVQYRNPREAVRYHIYTVDGQKVAEGLAPDMARLFHIARDGLAYHVVMPELEDVDEAASNPRIEVYRYIGPRKADK